MRYTRVEPPRINKSLFRIFGTYAEWYVRRHFHAIRVAGAENARIASDIPLVVVLNHPSWWDPLIALLLARRYFPDRNHYAPIDSTALQKYRFFGRLGFFGIEPGTAMGGANFLRTGGAILRARSTALWVTAQGSFADPRLRPVSLKPGVGKLVRLTPDAVILPVAVEYPFWQERTPEALVRFGDLIVATGVSEIASALERVQDRLAQDAIARNASAFDVLAAGATGTGSVYDWWRAGVAWIRGERFHRAHGPERL